MTAPKPAVLAIMAAACVLLGAGLMAGPAGAQSPAAPVLGASGLMPNGSGWGTVAPVHIYNGGVPSGMVNDIVWTGWGRPTASGRGRKPTYRPEGGYYAQQVGTRLRASRLATCPGATDVRAYTRLIVSSRTRPGGPWGEWFPWTLDLCDYDAEPKKCGNVAFRRNSEDGAFRITAWDTSCATARAVARAARAVRVRAGSGSTGMATYKRRWRGFRCSGYSFQSDELPHISWTCYRNTAQVTFERS